MERELRIQPGREHEFEERFLERWPRLLRSSEGYVRTELVKEVGFDTRYRITDVWQSHYEFEAFREQQREELKRFQEAIRADGIVETETQLGAYYGPEDDSDEGALAPA